jgi:hypothetical protein
MQRVLSIPSGPVLSNLQCRNVCDHVPRRFLGSDPSRSSAHDRTLWVVVLVSTARARRGRLQLSELIVVIEAGQSRHRQPIWRTVE